MLKAAPALQFRCANIGDLDAIRRIYNEGIEDRIATLDESPKDVEDIEAWWANHDERFAVLVALDAGNKIVGWASLNPYSHRCAYRGVADLSVYVARSARGTRVGSFLLPALERIAKEKVFHKIVLFAFPSTKADNASIVNLATAK